ncbi:HD domain-containing phosphohydrolase [Candidatus Xianfuyuplasma coldseepsis]|uniref:HD domain-containing protein n=1 Tax=Candidatus Xianfuyuplasma coldseepsis TaxID=2782163 RepID=A0A7L7KR56_9MOLU|nr:HD domain-containing phosphohydrolase [Xianfuyuplasma coldseepsis]QMS85310.1 HD domain-containing protein [Xianfuyuplasma coldseepsis]
MFDHLSIKQRNGIIFIATFLMILLGLSYTQFHGAGAFFYPAAGLYTMFFYIYRKQVLPGIISAVVLGNLAFRILYVDEALYITFFLALLFTVANLAEVFVFSWLMDRSNLPLEKELKANDLGLFLLIIVATGMIGALFGVTSLSLFYGFEHFLDSYPYWASGSIFGILIFGSLILNSHLHDDSFHQGTKRTLQAGIFLVVFGLITVFVFAEIGHDFAKFENFQIFIILMYIIASFKFSYRMIFVINIILMVILNIVAVSFQTGIGYTIEAVEVSLFIMIVSIIASIVRIILLERQENLDLMKQANTNLEQLIVSTNNLLNVENTLPEEVEQFERNYLERMFLIACTLYPNFDRASCNIKNEDYVEFIAAKGYDIDYLNQMEFLSKGFVWSFDTPKLIRDTDYDIVFENNQKVDDFVERYGRLKESIRFTVFRSKTEYAGMSFDIYHDSDKSFKQDDLENFASFQRLMNSYFSIGSLLKNQNQMKDDIVLSLVRTLELYDRYTGGHSEHVATLCANIAKELRLAERDIRNLYWAGIVHDIGKVGVSSDVLNKKGRLTKDEYELIKEHPVYGYKIISQSEGLSDIARIVRHHHEWWNGKGYPDGLQGDQIPFLSQILHICDAVDAMAHNRVYQPKLSNEEIIQQLREGEGQQFSPRVTNVMIQYIQSGRPISK